MKPEIDQEIWHIFNAYPGLSLEKMTVGYIGKEGFICHEQVTFMFDKPIGFDDYGRTWFLTEEEGLEWLKRNGYEWNEYIYAYVKKRGKE